MSEPTLNALLRPTLQALQGGPSSWTDQRAVATDLVTRQEGGGPARAALGEATAVRIVWTNHLLVAAGLIETTDRGSYALTAAGRARLEELERGGRLSLTDLRSVPEFQAWEKRASRWDAMRMTAVIEAVTTWVPFFGELADRLLPYRGRQDELIAFIEELRGQGLTVTPLNDKDADGNVFPFTEIDPFTFIGTINRNISYQARVSIASAMRDRFSIEVAAPVDFDGMPVLNNLKSWFLRDRSERGPNDTSMIWDVLEHALHEDPWSQPNWDTVLDRAFALPQVKVNLTMALFWIRPQTFPSMDTMARQLLMTPNPPAVLSASVYRKYRDDANRRDPFPIARSLEAYLAAEHLELAKKRSATTPRTTGRAVDRTTDYWLVGATWDAVSQVERFVKDGVWEVAPGGRYADQVASMKPGDKIALKSTFVQRHDLPFEYEGRTASVMRIHATGTITTASKDGRTVAVEWDPDANQRDWYHFTNRNTVWHLNTSPNYSMRDHVVRLIDFVWGDTPQDLAWYARSWLDWKRGATSPSPNDGGTEVDRPPYGPESMKQDGIFAPIEQLERMITLLRRKRTLILQGPPGVGKTFMARRLAYALMAERADERVQLIQFHQSYAYDDFIRGFRPASEAGKFSLEDGVFLRFCRRAANDPDRDYVFVIDEINRGNLSQIFGEALMLIEGDKRSPSYAVPLAYVHDADERFYVPPNVYLVGLMNVADRSLAMVDYALRRRFAFVDLEPQFHTVDFRRWLADRGVRPDLIERIVSRMQELNRTIEEHDLLGPKYRVGHSYFTPGANEEAGFDEAWFDEVVTTEIAPLLHEYWFDDPETARAAVGQLLRR